MSIWYKKTAEALGFKQVKRNLISIKAKRTIVSMQAKYFI